MVDAIIRLYPANESVFSNNGLGALTDATKCVVKEERNGAFELELEYPTYGVHYEDIELRRLIFCKPNPYDDPQPFRIYAISKPLNGVVTINAEHISYDLSGYPVRAFSANSAPLAFTKIQQYAVLPCPFTFTTDIISVGSFSLETPSSIRAILGGDGSITDVFGGEYEFDKFSVYLHEERGADRGVEIVYGKNLTEFTQEENAQDVYTGVFPYWTNSGSSSMAYDEDYDYEDSDTTSTTEELIVVTLDDGVVQCKGEFGYEKIYILDCSSDFQEEPTQAQLRSRAQTYINRSNLSEPTVSFSLSFAEIDEIGSEVHLCDTIHIKYPQIGTVIDSKCIATEYDVMTNHYTSISLGEAHYSIAKTISDNITETTDEITRTNHKLKASIDRATKLITGNSGGYVVLHSKRGDGVPDEILIMDTPSIESSKKVWRWNNSGLGYSNEGYNGTYESAITMDGHIMGKFVDCEQLDCSNMSISGSIPIAALQNGTAMSDQLGAYSQWIEINTGSGITIGDTNRFTLNLTSEKIRFNYHDGENDHEMATITGSSLNIPYAEVDQRMRIGNYVFVKNTDGSVSIVKGT